MSELKQRKCIICERAYAPSTANQKYCMAPCRKRAEEWRSIKRDVKEFAMAVERRVNKMLRIK